MEIIYDPIILQHNTGSHPENAERIRCLGNIPITSLIPSESDLHLIHSPEYIQKIKESSKTSTPIDQDTILSTESFSAALYSAQATIHASETGNFAVVRPPGHHAHANYGHGFCLFNSIAIAAKKLANSGKKILIIDIDGHLGDGTEEIFYSSNQIMYISLHQHPAFPGKGSADEIGIDSGKGFTINAALPASSGDDIYLETLHFLLPIMKQFAPDVTGISAGFDGHHSDPLLELNLSVNCFYDIGIFLRENFQSVFATLEGGYNTQFLPQCLYNFLDGINGNKQRFTEDKTESTILTMETYEYMINTLKQNLKPYWNI